MKLDDAMLGVVGAPAPAATTGGSPTIDAQAWRREMERAQAGAWFHDFVGSRATGAQAQPDGQTDRNATAAPDAPAAARPAASPRAAASASNDAPSWTPMPALRMGSPLVAVAGSTLPAAYQAVAPAASAMGLAPTLTLAAWQLAATSPSTPSPSIAAQASVDTAASVPAGPRIAITAQQPGETEAEAPTSGSADSKPRETQREPSRLPVRVHVEGDAESATVWLGLDAQAGIDLPAVTRAIGQWLAQTGYGKPSWICNGQPLDPDDARAFDAAQDTRRSSPVAERFPDIAQPHGESA